MAVVVERDIAATMRDGAVLKADVYRPAIGRHPVLVLRTPYGKGQVATISGTLDPVRAAEAGYVVVVQDVRGRFASDGPAFFPYRDEPADSFDTIEWAAGLDVSNGRVGAFGVSYMGATAWQAAVGQPPHLGAIAAAHAPSDFYETIVRGGALNWATLVDWTMGAIGIGAVMRAHAGRPDLPAQLMAFIDDLDQVESSLYHQPPMTFPPALPREPEVLGYFFEMLRHPTRDAFWQSLLVRDHHGSVEVPALIVSGWHDLLLDGDLDHYARMRAEGATETARQGTRLVIGPWSHGQFGHVVGQRDFGLRANGMVLDLQGDLTALHVRWFDRWLKDQRNGVDEEPRVKLFVQGINRWRDEDEWPLSRATPTDLFLRAGGRLAFESPGADEPSDQYVYDPQAPCPTMGGSILAPVTLPRGPVDQAPLLGRSDVLVYTSEPLPTDLEVTGHVRAVLYAATDALDTDWMVKLCEVDFEGRTFNVCDGVVRARFRCSLDAPTLVPPAAVERYEIDLSATSMVFRAGHCLRVLVTSSDFPRYDRNPNTGEWPAEAPHGIRAAQRIFHDGARRSHVVLPVVAR